MEKKQTGSVKQYKYKSNLVDIQLKFSNAIPYENI